MLRNTLIAICLTLVLLPACKKEDNLTLSQSDYLIFGDFYGECLGHCVRIFKLEQDKLFEDTKKEYPNKYSFYQGNFVQLPQQKFDIAKDLINSFPKKLLNETDTVIGIPDAADQGGLYIEYNVGGVRKFWLLDNWKTNTPAEYHEFIDKVNEKIRQLS